MKHLLPTLSVLALLCFVAGVTVTALWLAGALAAAGCGLLAASVALVLLAWQVER